MKVAGKFEKAEKLRGPFRIQLFKAAKKLKKVEKLAEGTTKVTFESWRKVELDLSKLV